MTTVDADLHYDFTELLHASRRQLLTHLADCHSALANLAVRISFLRAEEIRGTKTAREQRVEFEGVRDAYTEKKWLLTQLLKEDPHASS